jgi:hypothetical protein
LLVCEEEVAAANDVKEGLPMLAPRQVEQPKRAFEVPAVKPLDKARWQAWIENGTARDRGSEAARGTAVKLASATVLICAGAPWGYPKPLEIPILFMITLGSLFLMTAALRARRFVFGLLFGAVLLVFNPVFPALHLAGDWQRAVVLVSALPFLLALTWRATGKELNE